ncbi:MAG: NUDIX domain-containing protein [Candidatus Nanoarchaeia archaeon]
MVEREKSCGAIVFRQEDKESKKLKYLILYRKASEHYRELWDFPRGNIEASETEQEAAAREIKEEAGITKLNFIPQFKESIKFFYRRERKLIHKEIVFLLVETSQKKVKLSFEHNSYKWASFDEALKLLTHKNSKEILTKANEFLKKRIKTIQKTLINLK